MQCRQIQLRISSIGYARSRGRSPFACVLLATTGLYSAVVCASSCSGSVAAIAHGCSPTKPKRVFDAMTGEDVAWEDGIDGVISVTVPRLRIHSAVVFEGA